MFDFIEQHKKAFLIGAIIIVVGLLVALLVVNKKQTAQPTTNAPEATPNDLNYYFLKTDISQEDKYLMLQGKILTEAYGTYSAKDTLGLLDVQNQSTDEFKQDVQKIIDSIPVSKDITTVADPNSIQLNRIDSNNVKVFLTAITSDKAGKETKINVTVNLTKQGQYWLTSNIVFQNE
ncbi:MAG TPA: hypothetical protein VHQ41_02290 [Patescibacteria group bacterium]|jgi:hypothetical protein|nr:hypothetical protein [Patescibacteria group bacterium]